MNGDLGFGNVASKIKCIGCLGAVEHEPDFVLPVLEEPRRRFLLGDPGDLLVGLWRLVGLRVDLFAEGEMRLVPLHLNIFEADRAFPQPFAAPPFDRGKRLDCLFYYEGLVIEILLQYLLAFGHSLLALPHIATTIINIKMYRRILNSGLWATLTMSFATPLLIKKPYRCLFQSAEPEEDLEQIRNRLKNRLSIVEYPSNTPNQDTTHFMQLDNLGGYAVAVFDGHGGNEVSQYLKNNLLAMIDNKIKLGREKEIKGDQEEAMKKIVTGAITEAFEEVENYILTQAENPEGSFKKKQGSCALVALVIDDYLYVANLGDSKAMVVSFQQGKAGVSSLTKRMNINNPMIFNKLRQIYDEKSTFSELEGKRYIQTPEGQIQLTGTLGDWFVKKHIAKLSKEYLESSKYKRSKRQNDSPSSLPLVTSKPQISYTQLKPTDAYLLLGSNGFWDEIKKDQIAQKFKSEEEASEYPAQQMLQNIVDNISKTLDQPQQFVRDLPYDIRPRIFDDISIVLVELHNQTQPNLE